jgi:flagellar protein FliS
MSYTNARGAIAQYKNMSGKQGAIESASPHRLIQMLFEGALEKIELARLFIEQDQIAKKAEHITWAMNIIDGLRLSLDKEVGGDIAENLEQLYDYMNRRLLEANLHSDPAILDEVSSLIKEIKSGWDAIPPDAATPQKEAL